MSIRALTMTLTSTTTTRRPTRRCVPVARLSVELLEDRRVPSFGPLVGHYSVAYSGGVTAADFNGDGHPDLAVVASNGNRLGVMLGNGDGSFQAVLPSGTVGNPIVASDLNGDARIDLVALTDVDLRVLPGNGDGTFQSPQVVVLPSQLPAGSLAYPTLPDSDLGGGGRPRRRRPPGPDRRGLRHRVPPGRVAARGRLRQRGAGDRDRVLRTHHHLPSREHVQRRPGDWRRRGEGF